MIVSNTRFRQSIEVNRQKRLADEIALAQAQISTQKRIQSASDDPLASARIAEIGRQHGVETSWRANVETASVLAARADTVLGTATNAIDRAKELMLSAVNGTNSAENRAMIAIELRSIAAEIQSLGESKDMRGAPLFSDGEPLGIPVGAGLLIAPVDSKERVFETVVTPTGTFELADIVTAAADALGITNDAARLAAGKTSLESLDAAATHVATVRGEHGLRASRLDALTERLEDSGIKLDEERITLESTDIAEAMARLQSKRVTLQAAQAIYAQLNQQTLFDLLR